VFIPVFLKSSMNKTLIVLASTTALLVACSKPAPPEEPIRAVKVMTVGVNTFSSGYEFAGEVKAQVESRLGFRVGGKLVVRHVELGQRVKSGQELAQIDPQDYRLAAQELGTEWLSLSKTQGLKFVTTSCGFTARLSQSLTT
jgi:multidrug efflux pump subunit AcrA (membrane-fusion protein)